MCRFPGVQAYRCAGVQVYRYAGVQVYRCTGVQVYRCTGVQVYRCAGVKVFRCAIFSQKKKSQIRHEDFRLFVCSFVKLRVPPLDSEMSCYYYYCSVTLRVPPWIL